MLLAEALQERAVLKDTIGDLRNRLSNNATYQEGSETAESPEEMLAILDDCYARLEELIAAINAANGRTVVEGRTLTEWLARRDCLRSKASSYSSLISDASRTTYRASMSEIRVFSAVNVKELRKKHDEIAKDLRETDLLIQRANWTIEM